jgi:hypothetical protein
MAEKDAPIEGCSPSTAKQRPDFVTVRQFTEYFNWPSESGLRWMIFNAQNNGLDRALIRVGRRVLIDTAAFEAWIRSHGKQ